MEHLAFKGLQRRGSGKIKGTISEGWDRARELSSVFISFTSVRTS